MRESTVVRRVKGWLEKKYPRRRGFSVEEHKREAWAILDLKVKKGDRLVLQVECKKTEAVLYHALGQCMCYFAENEVETYLAIPSNFTGPSEDKGSWEGWEEVSKILQANNSPIGLIVVYPGQVRLERRASV